MTRIISFTGGLGAQLFSASGYLHLLQAGEPVAADLRYFDRAPREALPGQPGQVSFWGWALDAYGLQRSDFRTALTGRLVPDGAEKLALAMAGFAEPGIRARFPVAEAAQAQRRQLFGERRYACLHIRRGDYLNVASYLVPDEAFLRALAPVLRLVDQVLVVSDSPLSPALAGRLAALAPQAVVATGGSPALVHGLMRLADVLVGSNSQFSLSAAALRSADQLTLLPARHDADPASDNNRLLASLREFQLFARG